MGVAFFLTNNRFVSHILIKNNYICSNRFQSKGMDVGVANDDLNGAFFEPSSSSDTEDEDTGNDMLKNSISKEKPMSFDKMESVKRNWEMRREEMKEEHKQEIQNIRSKLFAVSQRKFIVLKYILYYTIFIVFYY